MMYIECPIVFWCAFWVVAIILSVYWGVDGVLEDRKEKDEENSKEEITEQKFFIKYKMQLKRRSVSKNILGEYSIFISDFLVSIGSWICLSILICNLQSEKFDHFNIFLGTVAFLGITGYGYKIWERIGGK